MDVVKWVVGILVVCLFIVVLILMVNHRLKKEIQKREKLTAHLEKALAEVKQFPDSDNPVDTGARPGYGECRKS